MDRDYDIDVQRDRSGASEPGWSTSRSCAAAVGDAAHARRRVRRALAEAGAEGGHRVDHVVDGADETGGDIGVVLLAAFGVYSSTVTGRVRTAAFGERAWVVSSCSSPC